MTLVLLLMILLMRLLRPPTMLLGVLLLLLPLKRLISVGRKCWTTMGEDSSRDLLLPLYNELDDAWTSLGAGLFVFGRLAS